MLELKSIFETSQKFAHFADEAELQNPRLFGRGLCEGQCQGRKDPGGGAVGPGLKRQLPLIRIVHRRDHIWKFNL